MSHTHSVLDFDPHFIIDPDSREVAYTGDGEIVLIEGDQDSEVITFEMPGIIESHQMSQCNVVEIHFTNIGGTSRQTSAGVYEVKDLQVIREPLGTTLRFTWLVSETATVYKGKLSFHVKFKCVENGKKVYQWGTAVNDNSILVEKGMDNSGVVVRDLTDILADWRRELFSINYAYRAAVEYGFDGTEEEWIESLRGLSPYEIAVKNGFTGSEEDWLLGLHGDSIPGIIVSEVEPNVFPYFWFDTGTTASYHAIADLSESGDGDVVAEIEDETYTLDGATVESSGDDAVITL